MIARFGDCELDLDRIELRVGGDLVAVEPRVFAVLAYLFEHRDRVVSKEELLDELWTDRFVSESALTSRIKSARQAVGDDGRTQRVIRTTHGHGYQFVAAVELDESTPGPRPDAGRAAVDSGPTHDDPGDPWPLVGRHRALGEIERALGDPDLGGVVITGPSGIGKTRVATAAAERARALGWRVEHIRPAAAGRNVALSAVAHLVPSDLVDEHGRDGDLTQALAFARARAALESIGAGVRFALLVDDADQLDDVSRSLVATLIEAGSVFALVTQRRAEGEAMTFGELVDVGRLVHVALERLDDAELDALLFRVLAGPMEHAGIDRLTSLAQGRPGALRQLVENALGARTLVRVDDVWRVVGPLDVEGLQLGSGSVVLSDLGPGARAGAEILALARDLDLELAAEMIGDEALDELDRADLLTLAPGHGRPRVSIAHAHIARLFEDGLGHLRARRHKRRLVDALSGDDASPEDRARVVRWSVETGGRPPRTDVLAAARRAVDGDDDVAAETLLDHLDATDPGGDERCLRAELRFRQGRLAEAAQALDGVDVDDLEPSDALAVIRRRSAIAFHTPRGQRDAVELLDVGSAATSDLDPAIAAQWVWFQSQLGEVDQILARADDLLASNPGSDQILVGIAEALRLHGRADQALELLGQVDEDSPGGDVYRRATRHARIAALVECHLTRGDVPSAVALIEQHLPTGARASSPALPRAGARAHLLAGRPRAAAALVAVPITPLRGPATTHLDVERSALLARIHARLGDQDVTTRRVDEVLAGIDGLVGQFRWGVVASVADALVGVDRGEDARVLAIAEVDDAEAAGAIVTAADLLAVVVAVDGDDGLWSRLERVAAKIEGPLWPVRLAELRAVAD